MKFRKNRNFVQRLLDTNEKDISKLEAQIEVLDQQAKFIEKLLDNPITKQKTVDVVTYVDTKVVTKNRTYTLGVDEWLDRSDSPETLLAHRQLPFLGL